MGLLALGLALVTFSIVGLAVDGTRAFLLRRTLQNAADASALAGSGGIDVTSYYSSAGRRVHLDPHAARGAALDLLERRRIDARASVQTDGTGVQVSLRAEAPTIFLSLVGIQSLPVAVVARAEPVAGEPGSSP